MNKEYNSLLKLAKEIQEHFPGFYLAGGTALMLRHKHRVSIDLDFFTQRSFSFTHLAVKTRKLFHVETEERLGDNIDFFIEGKKVSFVFFPFKNSTPLVKYRGIKMASDYDIFLNKIYVAGRRVDPKDSYDAAFLYKTHKWKTDTIKKDFEKKFQGPSYEIFLGALLHFEDYPKLPKWVKSTLIELLK